MSGKQPIKVCQCINNPGDNSLCPIHALLFFNPKFLTLTTVDPDKQPNMDAFAGYGVVAALEPHHSETGIRLRDCWNACASLADPSVVGGLIKDASELSATLVREKLWRESSDAWQKSALEKHIINAELLEAIKNMLPFFCPDEKAADCKITYIQVLDLIAKASGGE